MRIFRSNAETATIDGILSLSTGLHVATRMAFPCLPQPMEKPMARVTVEDCVDKVPNRFDLVMLAAHRAREISAGGMITVDRDNDKNPVVALREIADETQSAADLLERLVESNQTQIEIDEPEEDQMALLMGAESEKPAEEEMSEEKLLRALMEAQTQT